MRYYTRDKLYYKSEKCAIRALENIAHHHNEMVSKTIDIKYIPEVGIVVSGIATSITLDLEKHTKKEMSRKLLRFMDVGGAKDYYKFTPNAVNALRKMAAKHGSDVTVEQASTFGIQISNGKSTSILNRKQHTKEVMQSRLMKYINGTEHHTNNSHDYYTSIPRAMTAIDSILCSKYNKHMNIYKTPENQIVVECYKTKDSITFQIDTHSKSEIKNLIKEFMEAIR